MSTKKTERPRTNVGRVISTQKPAEIENGIISKGAENEKQEDSSPCQRAGITTCPQMSPYVIKPRELSQILLMSNNKIESLKCSLNYTNIYEFMHMLNLLILL